MDLSQLVIAVRCNWCSRQLPGFRVHRTTSGQGICDDCLQWHLHALDFLGGGMPAGCQICGDTWDAIRARPGAEVRMYVVPKDGIYQILCERCTPQYAAKRRDLYGGTAYGHSLHL